MHDISYRLMTADDYDGVYSLWINTPGMGLNDRDDIRGGIEKYLRRNPSTSFVAVVGGVIAGAVLAGHDGRRGIIQHMAVARHEQRKGIGRRLVELAMTALEDEGITKVMLVAFAKNTTGNAFWQSQGFSARDDLVYRNRAISELQPIDT